MAAQGEKVRSRKLKFSTSALLRGVSAMARLAATNKASNLCPICAGSRFH